MNCISHLLPLELSEFKHSCGSVKVLGNYGSKLISEAIYLLSALLRSEARASDMSTLCQQAISPVPEEYTSCVLDRYGISVSFIKKCIRKIQFDFLLKCL